MAKLRRCTNYLVFKKIAVNIIAAFKTLTISYSKVKTYYSCMFTLTMQVLSTLTKRWYDHLLSYRIYEAKIFSYTYGAKIYFVQDRCACWFLLSSHFSSASWDRARASSNCLRDNIAVKIYTQFHIYTGTCGRDLKTYFLFTLIFSFWRLLRCRWVVPGYDISWLMHA